MIPPRLTRGIVSMFYVWSYIYAIDNIERGNESDVYRRRVRTHARNTARKYCLACTAI